MQQARFAPIASIAVYEQLAERGLLGNYHLLLAHEILAEPTRYRKVFNTPTKLIIVDNGVVELGTALSMMKLNSACRLVDADVLVLPDVLGDMEGTISASIKAYKELKRVDLFHRVTHMTVPQGEDVQQILDCAEVLYNNIGRSNYLGIPRHITNNPKIGTRLEVLYRLRHRFPNSWIHLLGFSENLADDIVCARQSGVLGIDSCYPMLMGTHEAHIYMDTVVHRPTGDAWRSAGGLNEVSLSNLRKVREWIGEIPRDADPKDVKAALSRRVKLQEEEGTQQHL